MRQRLPTLEEALQASKPPCDSPPPLYLVRSVLVVLVSPIWARPPTATVSRPSTTAHFIISHRPSRRVSWIRVAGLEISSQQSVRLGYNRRCGHWHEHHTSKALCSDRDGLQEKHVSLSHVRTHPSSQDSYARHDILGCLSGSTAFTEPPTCRHIHPHTHTRTRRTEPCNGIMHGNEITITMSRRHLLLVVGARTPHEDHLMVGYPGHEQLNQSDDIMTVSQHSGTGGWSRWSSTHLGRPSSSTLDLPFMGFSPLLLLVVIIAHPHDGCDRGLQTSDIRSSHSLRREAQPWLPPQRWLFPQPLLFLQRRPSLPSTFQLDGGSPGSSVLSAHVPNMTPSFPCAGQPDGRDVLVFSRTRAPDCFGRRTASRAAGHG